MTSIAKKNSRSRCIHFCLDVFVNTSDKNGSRGTSVTLESIAVKEMWNAASKRRWCQALALFDAMPYLYSKAMKLAVIHSGNDDKHL